jgi:hypothetical protein
MSNEEAELLTGFLQRAMNVEATMRHVEATMRNHGVRRTGSMPKEAKDVQE